MLRNIFKECNSFNLEIVLNEDFCTSDIDIVYALGNTPNIIYGETERNINSILKEILTEGSCLVRYFFNNEKIGYLMNSILEKNRCIFNLQVKDNFVAVIVCREDLPQNVVRNFIRKNKNYEESDHEFEDENEDENESEFEDENENENENEDEDEDEDENEENEKETEFEDENKEDENEKETEFDDEDDDDENEKESEFDDENEDEKENENDEKENENDENENDENEDDENEDDDIFACKPNCKCVNCREERKINK
jgi:hypothetical protein